MPINNYGGKYAIIRLINNLNNFVQHRNCYKVNFVNGD